VDSAYFLNPNTSEEETDLFKISTGIPHSHHYFVLMVNNVMKVGSFLRDKTSGTHVHGKYSFIMQKAVKQFSPVVHVFEQQDDGDYNMMVAYKNNSTHSFFSAITELFRKEKVSCR
jgi:predicted HNH restriction endonuclease